MAQRDQRGSTLLFSLGLLILAGTLGSTMVLRSLHENRLGRRSAARHSALFLAEAGVDQALLNLRTPTDLTDDINAGTLPTGTFQIDNPAQSLGGLLWKVTTHGTSLQESRHLEAVIQLAPKSIFQFAVFGDQEVRIENTVVTDSFDSTLGSYQSQPAGAHGDVGSNNSAPGSITLEDAVAINGQVVAGAQMADPSSAVTIDGPVVITGSPPITTQSQPLLMPAVELPGGLTCQEKELEGSEVLSLDESQSPYCFTRLLLENDTAIEVTGEVVVYVGEFKAEDDARINAAGDPTQLLIQITSNADVVLENQVKFSGAIYAPQSEAKLEDTAELFGAVTAEEVKLENGVRIHYDEALSDSTDVVGGYRTSLASWREL